jgi:uncharacterized protein (TIGR02271 family)
MAMTDRSIVAGVFTDDSQAQQAIRDLQNAGFTDDQIRYSVHRGGSGITDSLKDLGLNDDEANFYNSEFMNGRTIVTVMSNDRQQEAAQILQNYGAYDFNSRGQTAGTAYANTADTAATYTQGVPQTGYTTTDQTYAQTQAAPQTGYTTTDQTYAQTQAAPQTGYADQGEQKVQLREEQLQATKERVQAGEVGIRKEVVEEQKTLNVPVSREEVYIERNPVNQPVPADTPIGDQGETYRVPVSEERVDVQKQPYVREEIGIGKRVVQDTQQVSDTVRREEAHIDRTGDVNVQGDNVVDTTAPDYNQTTTTDYNNQ